MQGTIQVTLTSHKNYTVYLSTKHIFLTSPNNPQEIINYYHPGFIYYPVFPVLI